MDTSSIWGNDKKSSNSQSSDTNYALNKTKEYSSQNEWGDFSDYSFSTPKENTNIQDLDFFQSSNQYDLNSTIRQSEWSDIPSTDKTFEDITSNVWSNHNTSPAVQETGFEVNETIYIDSEPKAEIQSIERKDNLANLPQSSSPTNIHEISFEETNIDKEASTQIFRNSEVIDTNFQIEDEFEDEFSDFTKPQLDFISNKIDSIDFYSQTTPQSNKTLEKSISNEKTTIEDEEFDDFQDFTKEEFNLQADWDSHIPNVKQHNIKKLAKVELLNQLNNIYNHNTNTDSKNIITSVEEVYAHLDIKNYSIQNVKFSESNSEKDQNTRKLVEKISESKPNNIIFNWETSSINKKYLSSFGLTSMIIERRQKSKLIPPHKTWGFGSPPLNNRHKKNATSKNSFQFEGASFINQNHTQPTKPKSSILQMENLLTDFEPTTITQSSDNSLFSISDTLEPVKSHSPTNSNANSIPKIKTTNTDILKPQSDNLIQGFDFSPSSSPKQLLTSFPPLIPPPP